MRKFSDRANIWILTSTQFSFVIFRYAYDAEAAETLYSERGIVARHFSMTWGFIGFTFTKDTMYMEYVNNKNEIIYDYSRSKASK